MRMVRTSFTGFAVTLITFAFLICVLAFTRSFFVCLLSDDFPESTGVKRIVQALNANVWSSVEMKDGEMSSPVQLSITLSPCLFILSL